jgi:hypothetical protein
MFSWVSTWILSKLNTVFRTSIVVNMYMFMRATVGFSPRLIYREWPQKTIPLLNNTTRGKLWVTRGSYAVTFLCFVLFSCQCVPHPLGVHMHILLLHEVISSSPPLKSRFIYVPKYVIYVAHYPTRSRIPMNYGCISRMAVEAIRDWE